MRIPRPVSLLLVEDDALDVITVKRALQTLQIDNPLVHASDGIEALEILRGEHGCNRLQPPFVVLLDLNLPRMNGIEFLRELRRDEALNTSIVFILTTSSAEEDVSAAYREHVAGYIVKSEAQFSVEKALRILQDYWTLVQFPPGEPVSALSPPT